MPNLRVFYKIEIHDKNGRLISTKKGQSKSFVLQFLTMLQAQMSQVVTNSRDITNTPIGLGGASNIQVSGGPGTTVRGIIVGTGTNVPANTDYALQTQIGHGAGAGQLNYGAQSFTAAAIVGSNVDFILTRTFTNASGGTITIKEIGVYADGGAANYFCIMRDAVSQAVNNLQIATVTYTLRTTV